MITFKLYLPESSSGELTSSNFQNLTVWSLLPVMMPFWVQNTISKYHSIKHILQESEMIYEYLTDMPKESTSWKPNKIMHFAFHPVLSFVWVGRWWWWWWGSLWKWQWKFPFLVCCLFSECNTPKSEHSGQSRRQHCTCTNYSTLCNYECGEMVAHTTLSPNNEWSSLFYLVGMWVMTVHLISLRSDGFFFYLYTLTFVMLN